MALEDLTGTKYINSLVSTNPTSTDNKSEGDDHLRGIKNVVKLSFPNISGAVTATHTELNVLDGITSTTAELNILDGVTATTAEINHIDGVTSNIQTQIDNTAGRRGALVYTSSQSIPNSSTTLILFGSEDYDTDSIHSTVTNTSRLTVPTGITKVRLSGSVSYASNSTGYRSSYLNKNASSTYNGGTGVTVSAVNGVTTRYLITSPVLNVSGGDYFELTAEQNSGGSLSIAAWFAMEIIK